MQTTVKAAVHRWMPKGNTPCGLRISTVTPIKTNVGRTANHGVTCPDCLRMTSRAPLNTAYDR